MVDLGLEPEQLGDRLGGLDGPLQRRGDQAIDPLALQVLGQVAGLCVTGHAQFGVGCSGRELDSEGQSMADQQEFQAEHAIGATAEHHEAWL